MIEILKANYWEHYKWAKDLALIYPVDHPKRVALEKTLNEPLTQINALE
jgi:hypothetical protein